MKARKSSTVVTGLSTGQAQYFQQKLGTAISDASYIKKGKQLEKMGNFDGAIENYKRALSGYKGVARICIANAYEKKHDYKTALEWMILVRDHVNEWAKKPHEERVKYLGYALQGEYELAVTHAKKAIEDYMSIYSDMPVQKQEYIDRLNDLIAAKDHILSLKQ